MTAVEYAIVRERRIKLFFFLGSLILAFLFVLFVNNMMVSLIVAVTMYYLLAPLVDLLERWGLSRIWATTIPFLTVIVVVALTSALLLPALWDQVKVLQNEADKYTKAFSELLDQAEGQFGAFFKSGENPSLRHQVVPLVSDWAAQFFKGLPDLISKSFTVLLLAPFFGFFLLLDGRDLLRKWLNFVPNNIFELSLNLSYQIGTQIGGFVRARLIESVFVAIITWVGLMILGFPFALALAFLAGVLNIIPYVGPVIAAGPVILISLANGDGLTGVLLIAGLYVLIQFLDGAILVPFLVARIVNLHPVTVIVAVIMGSQLLGILGMIICIPLVSALKVTTLAVYRHLINFRT
ncbi:MAG: hypothetical protein C5B49_14380 [Bdellovibrio sp.]|nr:MAG: hypothetical protein C5B49_14380 [Bdellovibrio sp.]